jgi:hypothetical protein
MMDEVQRKLSVHLFCAVTMRASAHVRVCYAAAMIGILAAAIRVAESSQKLSPANAIIVGSVVLFCHTPSLLCLDSSQWMFGFVKMDTFLLTRITQTTQESKRTGGGRWRSSLHRRNLFRPN